LFVLKNTTISKVVFVFSLTATEKCVNNFGKKTPPPPPPHMSFTFTFCHPEVLFY
jgi:hypothetical protein